MRIKLLAIMLVCCALLAACAGQEASGGQAETVDGTDISGADASGEGTSGEEATPAKIVYGEISEVIGNALVIKTIEMPEGFDPSEVQGQFAGGNMGEGGFTLADGTEIPIGEDGRPDLSNIDVEGFMDRFTGEGGMGEWRGEGGGPGMTGEGGTAIFDEGGDMGDWEGRRTDTMTSGRILDRAYTGEEIEVIIPVGIPVMTRTMGESGIEESEVSISDLQSGTIITITYKADEKTIDTVYVTQNAIRSSGGGGGGAGEFIMSFPAGAVMIGQ